MYRCLHFGRTRLEEPVTKESISSYKLWPELLNLILMNVVRILEELGDYWVFGVCPSSGILKNGRT
jgi:hypothetical protein